MVNRKYKNKEEAEKAKKEKRKKYNDDYQRKLRERKMQEKEENMALIKMYREGMLYNANGDKLSKAFLLNL